MRDFGKDFFWVRDFGKDFFGVRDFGKDFFGGLNWTFLGYRCSGPLEFFWVRV